MTTPHVVDGRWKIEKKLGQGAFGTVYKAIDLVTGEPVAVKLMTPEAIAEDSDGVMTELFRREGQREYQAGPGAVQPVASGENEDGSLYLVTEYLEGSDLESARSRNRGYRLPVDEVVDSTNQILGTLKNMHKKGIVHRDIKPANVFRTKDGDVKLIDFGMADSVRNPFVPPGDFIGTYGFSPPEQVDGRRTTSKSDIWSTGATAYAELTGGPPVDCNAPLLSEVAPHVPKVIAEAIDHALECDPRDRPSAHQMLKELNPGVARLMAMETMSSDVKKSMSTGTKLAIATVVAGVLFGAYQIASAFNEEFAKTPMGRWIASVPEGGYAEANRLGETGVLVAWPEFVPPKNSGVTSLTAAQAGTSFPWPPGTTFWKVAGTPSAQTVTKTANGPDAEDLATLYVDAFGRQWIIGPAGASVAFRPSLGVVPGHAYAIGPMMFDGSYEILSDITKGTPMTPAKTAQGPAPVTSGTTSTAAPTGVASTVEDTLYVDANGKQWAGNMNADGTFNTLEPIFRPANNVVPGHYYRITFPPRPGGYYDILQDLTTGVVYKSS